MTTTTYTETRFVIANAAGRPADDLGGSPIFASEAAAEEAVESLTASGFDMDDYSVRELTTADLTGDERDAMLTAVRAEGEAAARQERAACGSLAAWGDVSAQTWAALDALLVTRFGVVIASGRDGDDVLKAYRAGREAVAEESVVVSTDNGATTESIDTVDGARAFLRRYGAQNVARELADAGLPTEDYADDLAVLVALADAQGDGEIPTLP